MSQAIPVEAPGHESDQLKVRAYDKVASMLISLLLMVGTVFFVLLVLWISNRVFPPTPPVTLEYIPDEAGGLPNGMVGESMAVDSPLLDEIVGETNMPNDSAQETIQMVLDALAVDVADIAEPTREYEEALEAGTRSRRIGGSENIIIICGPCGPCGPCGMRGIPRCDRWEVQYLNVGSLAQYSAQLDFFGIEVVSFDPSTRSTTFVGGFTRGGQPHGPLVPVKDCLFMNWKAGDVKQTDATLLQNAGVQTDGRVLLQYYSHDVEMMLLWVELSYAGLKEYEIAKTRFGVRAKSNGGFEFYVIGQSPL